MSFAAALLATLTADWVSGSPPCDFSPVGTWRLVSVSSRTANGRANDAPYGAAPTGLLIYTAGGRMSVMISYSDRQPLSSDDRAAAPVEERAQAFTTFYAYSGRYTFSCDRVVHHVEIASVPNWVNTDQIRTIKHTGNRLTLGTPPRKLAGLASTFDLTWERLP